MLSLTPREAHFYLYTRDKVIFEERKHDFELMRMQTFFLLKPHMGKKNKVMKPADLFSFPWDKLPKVKLNKSDYSEANFAALEEKYK